MEAFYNVSGETIASVVLDKYITVVRDLDDQLNEIEIKAKALTESLTGSVEVRNSALYVSLF